MSLSWSKLCLRCQSSIRSSVNAFEPFARYRILMVEVLKHNGRPETGAVYEAMDMDWAKLVDQMAHANGK